VARIIRVERECVKYLFLIFIYAFNCLSEINGSGDEWIAIRPADYLKSLVALGRYPCRPKRGLTLRVLRVVSGTFKLFACP
jgi:hypothetical protein